jgi:Leucine-rich repeat (LRR) protein
MNKTTAAILTGTFSFSLLFFDQSLGANFLIYTLILLLLLTFLNSQRVISKQIMFLLLGTIYSGSCVIFHGSLFAAVACSISIILIPAYLINKSGFVFHNLLSSVYSFCVSPLMDLIQNFERKKTNRGSSVLKVTMCILTIIIGLIFFFIYRNINPLFLKHTAFISMDLLSINWLIFTFLGWLIAYNFFKQKKVEEMDGWFFQLPLFVVKDQERKEIKNERLAFTSLFIWLNAMLLIINLMDVQYLYLDLGLPDDITHKQFVHNGVNMLILSIVLGICLLLYFFRGSLNFIAKNKFARVLAILWIAQNIIMVVSTVMRNTLYVNEALLTYKRIGVYFWLLFAIIGLFLGLIKIIKLKTSWYIIRNISGAMFVVLILSASVDWDQMISKFNVNRMVGKNNISSFDKRYLLSLSETNIADLHRVKDKYGFEIDSTYSYGYERHGSNQNWLDYKTYQFLKKDFETDWRSFSFRHQRVLQEIQELNKSGLIRSLNFVYAPIPNLIPLLGLTNLENLYLSPINHKAIGDLNEMKNLRHLSITNNYLTAEVLDTLEGNSNLTSFALSNNLLENLRFLKGFPSIRQLDVASNKLISLSSLPELSRLEEVILDNNPLRDIEALEQCKALKVLSVDQLNNKITRLPSISTLEEISAVNSYGIRVLFQNYLSKVPNLRKLNLSNNLLKDLGFLQGNVSQNLKELDLSNGYLNSIEELEQFPNIEKLDLSNNHPLNFDALNKLHFLKDINLEKVNIKDLNCLVSKDIKHLNLSLNDSISSYSKLKELKALMTLDLSFSNFNDLGELSCYHSLQNLNLNGVKLKTMAPIKAFKNLKALSISWLEEKDILSILELDALEIIYVFNTDKETIKSLQRQMKGQSIEIIIN